MVFMPFMPLNTRIFTNINNFIIFFIYITVYATRNKNTSIAMLYLFAYIRTNLFFLNIYKYICSNI